MIQPVMVEDRGLLSHHPHHPHLCQLFTLKEATMNKHADSDSRILHTLTYVNSNCFGRSKWLSDIITALV